MSVKKMKIVASGSYLEIDPFIFRVVNANVNSNL